MPSSPLRLLRKYWLSCSERPLVLLSRLFIGRLFHGTSDSGGSDLNFSVGVILALLPLPGGFYAVFLFEKYSTLLQWMRGEQVADPAMAALPEEYFFIVLSMVVSGVVAVWRWDSIFPDRRDHANLAPLPLSRTTIFLANLTAIAFSALVLAIDVNAASGLLFPLAVGASVDSFSFFVHFVGVHIYVVLLASIFSFFSVFLVVGLLMVALPYFAFRRISLYLRSAIVGCLVATLASSFAVPLGLRDYFPLLKFLPAVWFLGLSQLLHSGANSALAALGHTAPLSTLIVIVASVVIYTVTYRACFVRIPEGVESNLAVHRGTRWTWIFRLLDRTVMPSPFQKAGYRYAIKTLFRSERHGLILGGFLGLGIVTASQFLLSAFSGRRIHAGVVPSAELLAIPLIVSYCMIVGVRVAFEVPSEIQANWVFKFLLDRSKPECASMALKVMLSFVLPWVFAIALPVYGYLWGWRVALLQVCVVTAWSLLLAEILLFRFRKLPFTCPPPAFRDSAIVLALSYVLGFFVFVVMTAQLEYWALSSPIARGALVGIGMGFWYLLYLLRKDIPEIDKEPIFEQETTRGFELLDLGHAD